MKIWKSTNCTVENLETTLNDLYKHKALIKEIVPYSYELRTNAAVIITEYKIVYTAEDEEQ